jgi:hypothetical protein
VQGWQVALSVAKHPHLSVTMLSILAALWSVPAGVAVAGLAVYLLGHAPWRAVALAEVMSAATVLAATLSLLRYPTGISNVAEVRSQRG